MPINGGKSGGKARAIRNKIIMAVLTDDKVPVVSTEWKDLGAGPMTVTCSREIGVWLHIGTTGAPSVNAEGHFICGQSGFTDSLSQTAIENVYARSVGGPTEVTVTS